MFQHIARLSIIAATLWLVGCGDRDPNPAPLRKVKPDGSPWVVRYVYWPDDPKSLDPQYAYEQTSHRILEPIYDTLLEYHPLKTDPYQLRPCMLEAMPERVAEPDGKVTYRCRLKKDIHFHDDPCFPGGKGREVTTRDLEFAFLRMADPKVECPIAGMLSENLVGFDEVTKAVEKAGHMDYDGQHIPGLEIVDHYSFSIHLLKPYPQIRFWMAQQFLAPVAREALDYYDGKEHPDGPHGEMVFRETFRNRPVGTGPYRFVKWERNERITLERNPNYHTTTFPSDGIPGLDGAATPDAESVSPERAKMLHSLAGKPVPFVDEVQIREIRELFSTWLLTKQGYLDRMGVSKDAFGQVMASGGKELAPSIKAKGFSTEFELELSTFYFELNLSDPILQNKKLRQALSCAFDARSESEIFYNGTRPTAEQLIPPGIFGHEKDRRNPWTYNLEKARKLLAEAGYPDGRDPKTGQPLEITMDTVADSSELRAQAAWEQAQFESIGIKIKVVENAFGSLMNKEIQGTFQIAAGSGWGADYPDPENFFMLFYSKNFPPNGRNDCRYNNPEYDRLYEQMSKMDDTPERLKVCHQMMDLLAEDSPVIFNFHKGDYVIYPAWGPPTNDNMMLDGGLKYAVIDPVLREQKRREWNQPVLWPLWFIGAAVLGALVYAIRFNRTRNA